MSKQLNLYEAKTQLSKLVDEAAKGEEIIIAKNGVPAAVLTSAQKAKTRKKRRFGLLKGKVHSPTDAQWAALDREIAEEFEASLDRPIAPK